MDKPTRDAMVGEKLFCRKCSRITMVTKTIPVTALSKVKCANCASPSFFIMRAHLPQEKDAPKLPERSPQQSVPKAPKQSQQKRDVPEALQPSSQCNCCGAVIPSERIAALPETALCVRCTQLAEKNSAYSDENWAHSHLEPIPKKVVAQVVKGHTGVKAYTRSTKAKGSQVAITVEMAEIVKRALRILRKQKELRVRHKDGASGAIIRPIPMRPGDYWVRFDDGVCAPQSENVLFFEEKNLSLLCQSSKELNAEFSSIEREFIEQENLSRLFPSRKELNAEFSSAGRELREKKARRVAEQSVKSDDQSTVVECLCRGADGRLKNIYASKVAAQQAAKNALPLPLDPYQCVHGNWHLTKAPKVTTTHADRAPVAAARRAKEAPKNRATIKCPKCFYLLWLDASRGQSQHCSNCGHLWTP